MLQQRLDGPLRLEAVEVALEVQPRPTDKKILDCMELYSKMAAPRQQDQGRWGARGRTCGHLRCQAGLQDWIYVAKLQIGDSLHVSLRCSARAMVTRQAQLRRSTQILHLPVSLSVPTAHNLLPFLQCNGA